MAVCETFDPDCYGCRLRAKGIRLSNEATPTRQSNRPKVFTKGSDPSWEKGIAGEQRPDGSFMPFIGADRAPIGVKEHGERRHEIADQVKRLKSDPTVFASERT